MKNVLVALSVALALSGCLKSTAKVSSGKLAVIPPLTVDSSGTVVPLALQAQVSYVGTFYNYQNPLVNMGQTVFAAGDGALMIYGSDFSNNAATTVILRNAATLQEVALPASQFTITANQMQMKQGFQIPATLPGGPGLFYLIVKNANAQESSPYQIMMVGQRPKLEYRLITNIAQNGTLLTNSPAVGPLVGEAIVSSHDIYNTGIIPYSSFIQVKNAGSVSITLLHSNFFNSASNDFYGNPDISSLEIADTTVFLEANAPFTAWPGNVKFCKAGTSLAANEVCYLQVTLNYGLSTGPVHDNPNCYDFIREHTIEFTESAALGLPPTIRKFNIHAKAYYNSVPYTCGVIGGGSTNFQAASSVSSFSTPNAGQLGSVTISGNSSSFGSGFQAASSISSFSTINSGQLGGVITAASSSSSATVIQGGTGTLSSH